MNTETPVTRTAKVVTVHEAKTHLSRLIKEVTAGGEVTIKEGRTGEALVKLVRANAPVTKRELGWLRDDSRGSDPLAYGFWDPIPEIDLALWEGTVDYPDVDAPAA